MGSLPLGSSAVRVSILLGIVSRPPESGGQGDRSSREGRSPKRAFVGFAAGDLRQRRKRGAALLTREGVASFQTTPA